MSARPIVKWAGGKSRLLPELVARMPVTYRRYYEPFAGSAALYLRLQPESATLADTNADLMNVYQQVARDPDAVIHELEVLAAKHSEGFYKRARAWWNESAGDRNTVLRAASFLYFNKACFNGLWRVNRDGEFNVPLGDYPDPKIVNADEIRAAAPAFAHASLVTSDYRFVVASATVDDFVYFDPPYLPSSATAGFTAYTPDGFGEPQHRELAATFHSLAARGVQVMLSSSDTSLTWDLYKGRRIERIHRRGTINRDRARRHPVAELIVTSNYARKADLIAINEVDFAAA